MHQWWTAVARKEAIVQEVKHVYAEYAFLAQHIRIVDENVTLLRNLEPIVQVRLRSGGNQGDLLRLQIEIAKLENELLTLESLRPALNRQLRAILNESNGDLLPWPVAQETSEETFQPGDLLQKVQGNNLELKQLDALAMQSEHQVNHHILQKKPEVTVGLTYIDTGAPKMTPKPSDSSNDPFGITLGVSIPIWSKKYDAGIRQARYMESSIRHRIKQKRLDLGAQLEMEAYRLQDAARSITLYRDTLIPRARQAMEVIQVSYQSGNTSLLDIIESERNVLVFQQSYWRSQRDYAQSRAKIEALCGGDLS
jgi:outer membrane protein, heavy metal efflux system